ncbi:MAG: Ca-activated chloride channel family protein [Lentisphaeria bacterium]|jgi:Ca-activated chloride channel family protein
MLQFEWPWAFVALVLPLVIYYLIPRASREEAALRTPFYHRVESALSASHGIMDKRSRLNTSALCLLWLMLVSAAVKPMWVGDPVDLPASGRDLLVAVDISGSMETADMVIEDNQIPRILIVKYVVGEFVKRRESDRIGLILFGTNAYLQSPLTFDRTTVDTLLQEAQLGFAGEKTAIGDAIGLAIKRLKDRPESQRVLILLTDGANTAGEVAPRQAADLAKQAGVKIYTIGVGAEEMKVRTGLFNNFERKVNPSADLDEETLTYIAKSTDGKYFRARNPAELESIYKLLDTLEPIEQEHEVYRPRSSLFYWPLALALLTSFVIALLSMYRKSFTPLRATQP